MSVASFQNKLEQMLRATYLRIYNILGHRVATTDSQPCYTVTKENFIYGIYK